MGGELVTQPIDVEMRFAISLLRYLIKLLRPETVGVAVLVVAAEMGIPRQKAIRLAERFMIEVTLPREWRPRDRKPGAMT